MRTFVVSWNDAPERNDSAWSDAFVMPSSSVCAVAGRAAWSWRPSLPSASASALASLTSSLLDEGVEREVGVAGLADADLVGHLVVRLAEVELVHDLVGQQVGVARRLDADLAEHLPQDDLDVLVGDRHALGAVHVLDLVQHVGVQRLLAP